MVTARVVTSRISAWDATGRTAVVDGVPGSLPLMRHVTAGAVGDTAVVLVQGGQAWVTGVLGVAPPPAPPETPPVDEAGGVDVAPPSTPTGPQTLALRPTWSGSWRAGAWRSDTSDLYQGDYSGRGVNQGGCWWGRLPSTMVAATLRVVRLAGAGAGAAQTPTMCLLAGMARPAGAPTVLATAPGPALPRSAAASWTVPAAWVAQMASGAAGGIGITSGGSRTPYLGLAVSEGGMTLQVTTTAA